MSFRFMCAYCLPFGARIAFTVCYALMTLFGGFGNFISIICIRKKNQVPNERDKIDQILLSLAVCDTLVSFTVYPLHGWLNYWEKIPFHHIHTKVFYTWTLAMTSVSSVTIIMLAAIKYFKLSRFSKFDDIITENRLRMMIVLSWLIPILFMCPYIITQSYPLIVCSFIITCSTLVSLPIFYFLILYLYKKSRQRVASLTSSRQQITSLGMTTSTYSRKLILRSLWLIGAYFLCTVLTIPCMVLLVLHTKDIFFYQLTNLVFLGNSCVNPCIYMYKDKKIRKIAKGLLRKCIKITR